MDDLGDSLVKIATDLIKAGAILPVVGFGCIYLMVSLAETAHELVRDRPLYWLCFGFAIVVGGHRVARTLAFRTASMARPCRRPACLTGSGTIPSKAYLLGPNAAKVMRHADCSAMVVRE